MTWQSTELLPTSAMMTWQILRHVMSVEGVRFFNDRIRGSANKSERRNNMRTFLSVCGCIDPTDELPTSRPPPRSRTKSSSIVAARLSSADPEIAKKLEELNQLRRDSKSNKVSNAPLQKKYDDLEGNLNKCKDDLRDLQRKSVTAAPSLLRQKYVSLGADLKRCKEDLQALHEEAKSTETESLQKKYEALEYVLLKYRKDIEDELQKCWTQLKLLHLESQFASPSSGDGEEAEEAGENETDTDSEEETDSSISVALERYPRTPRCELLWKPPLAPSDRKIKNYDERKLLETLSTRKNRLGYRDKPPKYY